MDVLVEITQDAMTKKWIIPTATLRDDADQVIWDLDELRKVYPLPAQFAIRFTSAPGPSALQPVSGPFFAAPFLIPPTITIAEGLGATGRNHEWGSYYYDILVYYPGWHPLQGTRIDTSIDPQIDNVAPPIDGRYRPDPQDDGRGGER